MFDDVLGSVLYRVGESGATREVAFGWSGLVMRSRSSLVVVQADPGESDEGGEGGNLGLVGCLKGGDHV